MSRESEKILREVERELGFSGSGSFVDWVRKYVQEKHHLQSGLVRMEETFFGIQDDLEEALGALANIREGCERWQTRLSELLKTFEEGHSEYESDAARSD